jgi:hypothetical protein
MIATASTFELAIERGVCDALRKVVPKRVGLQSFEALGEDATDPVIVVKAERQEEISFGTRIFEIVVTVMGRAIEDALWRKVEAALLDADALKARIEAHRIGCVRGEWINYDEPSSREAGDDFQRGTSFRMFARDRNQ